MTDGRTDGRTDGVAWRGLVSSAAAPVLLIGGWTLAARLQRDGFDPVAGTISALAALDADRRWVMTAALLGTGVAHVTTATALRPAPVAARVALAVGGVATVGVGLAPLPAGGGGSVAHTALAGVAFAGLAVWPALAARRSAAWPFPPALALAVGGVLAVEVAALVVALATDSPRLGLVERVAAGSQALVPLAAVLAGRRAGRGISRRRAPA